MSWPPSKLEATPLLKFADAEEGDETAYLAQHGLELFDSLPDSSVLCPIILMGDGRGGKSYLSSRILGVPGAFESNDTAEPVTEGIDMVIAPLAPLLKDVGLPEPAEQQHLLLLDCEGGNNAMAAIRTLVNVFGTLIGTEVVFVASGMASEQSLQTLGTSLAARSLIKLGGEPAGHLQQQLVFVVNKNTLRYDDNALEQILVPAKHKGTRKELRESILDAFPDRIFCTVPLMDMPDFEERVIHFRKSVLENRRPLMMGGIPVRKPQIRGLLELIVSEVQRTSEISFPSVNRYVVLEGFLLPLAKQLGTQANEQFPKLDDYDAELASKDCRNEVMARYDAQTAHIGHSALVNEARQNLQQQMDSAWQALEHRNESLGDEITESTTESRNVPVSISDLAPLGGTSLLKNIMVRTEIGRMEMRSLIRRKRGSVEYSDWMPTGMDTARLVETCLEGHEKLPQHEERLWKKSPHRAANIISLGLGLYHDRLCILKDCNFFWYDVVEQDGEGNVSAEDCGYINFLLQTVEIVVDDTSATSFTIRPASSEGWAKPHTFSGGPQRTFTFDCGVHEASPQRKKTPRPLSSDLRIRKVAGAFRRVAGQYLAPGFDVGGGVADARSPRPMLSDARQSRAFGGGTVLARSATPDARQPPAQGSAARSRSSASFNSLQARQRRDDWVAALRRHASFGANVAQALGREAMLQAFGDGARKYTLEEVRSGWH